MVAVNYGRGTQDQGRSTESVAESAPWI